MKFCEFLQILYKNKNSHITTQEDFVVQMFCSGGAKFSYSEGYGKNLLSGKKPLTDDIRSLVDDKYNFDLIGEFFYKNINKHRLPDLFEIFNIPKDIEQDLYVMSVACTFQFKHFMEEGNECECVVDVVYEHVLDKIVFGDKEEEANINAVLKAKEFIYNAITSLSSIRSMEPVLNNRNCFESFFSAIKSAHYAFIKNANYKGRQIYRAFCTGAYKKDRPQDKFLYEVAVQSYKPLNLIKQVKYIVYDNLTFKDSSSECTIDLFDCELEKRVEALKKVDPKGQREIFFTELIFFKFEDSQRNILEDYLYTLLKTVMAFDYFEAEFGTNEKIEKINKLIKEEKAKLDGLYIDYMTDGTFYPETDEIEYAPTIEPVFYDEKGRARLTGDDLTTLDRMPLFKDTTTIEQRLRIMMLFHAHMMREAGHFQEIMHEVYTFNEDGTFRLYYFPPTCKAKVYRKIRIISTRVKQDKTIGFMACCVMTYIDCDPDSEKYAKMLSKDREKLGKNCLMGYWFENGVMNCIGYNEEQILHGDLHKPNFGAETNIYNPIIYEIMTRTKK